MMGRQSVMQSIKEEIMEEINGPRRLQKNPDKIFPKKEEMDAVPSSAAITTTSSVNPISPSPHLLSFKGQPEENILRRVDPADDLQLMCTKKCIPCHRCGSSMKFFMRRVKYLNTVKEYPAYRCMKKKCQTFRSPRTLARECNMLLRQGFGDGRFMSVAPTTNATRQLKEAFPDHFNKQEMDGLQGFPAPFRDDFDAFPNNPTVLANSATSSIIREKEAWYALRNAKQSLDVLAHADGGLSLRLHRIINEIHAMATQFRELPKKEEFVNTALEGNTGPIGIDRMHDIDDESYDGSVSMRRSTANDLTSLTLGGDSRSSFDTELKYETSSIDTCISMKMSSSASMLSPSVTPPQPLRWINISRHSPSFSVKMVDSSGSVTRRTVDQRKHAATEHASSAIFESFPNCTNNSNSNTHEITIPRGNAATTTALSSSSSSSLPSIIYDQPTSSYDYGTTTNIVVNPVADSNTRLNIDDEGNIKNEPIPIYVRPSELCFDDVADGGEILSEFFVPSSTPSNFQPTTNDTSIAPMMSAGSNTIPIVTFAQFWNFNEHYDHKEANILPSQAASATICPL